MTDAEFLRRYAETQLGEVAGTGIAARLRAIADRLEAYERGEGKINLDKLPRRKLELHGELFDPPLMETDQ